MLNSQHDRLGPEDDENDKADPASTFQPISLVPVNGCGEPLGVTSMSLSSTTGCRVSAITSDALSDDCGRPHARGSTPSYVSSDVHSCYTQREIDSHMVPVLLVRDPFWGDGRKVQGSGAGGLETSVNDFESEKLVSESIQTMEDCVWIFCDLNGTETEDKSGNGRYRG